MSFSANDNYGEYKHKLTASEMPSHYHNVVLNDAKNDLLRIHYSNGSWGRYSVSNTSNSNTIQPYITFYFWRRTA